MTFPVSLELQEEFKIIMLKLGVTLLPDMTTPTGVFHEVDLTTTIQEARSFKLKKKDFTVDGLASIVKTQNINRLAMYQILDMEIYEPATSRMDINTYTMVPVTPEESATMVENSKEVVVRCYVD